MSRAGNTTRPSTAQAIVRWLAGQYIDIDEREFRVCGGGFRILRHGGATRLGEALHGVRSGPRRRLRRGM